MKNQNMVLVQYTANEIEQENQREVSDTISDLLAKDRSKEVQESLI